MVIKFYCSDNNYDLIHPTYGSIWQSKIKKMELVYGADPDWEYNLKGSSGG